MDVDAVVGAVAEGRLARVHAHAHAQLDTLRPGVSCERALRLGDGLCSLLRVLEDDEELVTSMVDDVPAAALDGRAQELRWSARTRA